MSRLTTRRIAVALSLAAAGVTGVVFATTSSAATKITMISIGDSYSSGAGVPQYINPACKRTPNSFLANYASSRTQEFTFLACANADTTGTAAQLARIKDNPGADLVTFSAGADDIRLFQAVATCAEKDEAACLAAVDEAGEAAGNALPAALDELYDDIHTGNPDAAVVTFGYPRLFETDGSCPDDIDLSDAERTAVNGLVDKLDLVLAARAEAAGATFVDPRERFAGHGLCGADPWVDAATLAPNKLGNNEYLEALIAATPAG